MSNELMEKIKSIPDKPGVYLMKDSRENIIYIGKSKCLNKRVRSYFQRNIDFNKIKQLVFNIYDIETIITDTHLEAQILECSLIKKHKPIYNSQFKNDKKYVYLTIKNDSQNLLTITLNKENEYSYGPYRSRNTLMELVRLLRNIYPIIKGEELYKFSYHPLPINCHGNDFNENRKSLIDILSQEKSLETFLSLIKTKMEDASCQLQFERASYYRNLLSALNYLYHSNKVDITKGRKVLAGERLDDGYKLFYIIDGNLVSKKKFSKINWELIKDFLTNMEKFKSHDTTNKDEKSNLDFKTIISRELKTNLSMQIQYIDDILNLDIIIDFLNRL